MLENSRSYIPAAGYDWSLPLYDPFVKLLGGDALRRELARQAHLGTDQRVLDIGCGTGTLVTLIKRLHPMIEVVGIDPDPKALARARKKASRDRQSIQMDRGFADDLPYEDASFDRVFSSFMFHHLSSEEKTATLSEVQRVLKHGGSFHLVDFGASAPGRDGFIARLLHLSHHFKDNSETQIVSLMNQAGLDDAKAIDHRRMMFLPVTYYQGRRPE